MVGLFLIGLVSFGYAAFLYVNKDNGEYIEVKNSQAVMMAELENLRAKYAESVTQLELIKSAVGHLQEESEKVSYPQPQEIKVKFENMLPVQVYKKEPKQELAKSPLLNRAGIKKK